MRATSLFLKAAAAAALATFTTAAFAADAPGAAAKTAINYEAIFMFLGFVAITLVITAWAAKRTKFGC